MNENVKNIIGNDCGHVETCGGDVGMWVCGEKFSSAKRRRRVKKIAKCF